MSLIKEKKLYIALVHNSQIKFGSTRNTHNLPIKMTLMVEYDKLVVTI